PLNPTLFVTSHVNGQADPYICNGVGLTNIFFLALALNRDGSVNSCSNPAKAGSEITLFVNGLGTYAGTQITGSLIADPKPVYPFFQSPAAAFVNGLATAIDSFTDEPGAISGLSQVQVHLPTAGISQGLDYVGLSVNGVSAGPFRAGTSQGTVPASVAVFVSP
ncbi:MAG TPA: hypothetical protein VFC21_01050, partial [Bryobacteraceae bacterium]|nr:hypothetical protein [Bryobacteraceae bacterium]